MFLCVVQTVARRLAEVLLTSMSEDAYWGPLTPPPPTWLDREGATHPKDAMYPSSRPPQTYGSEGSDSVYASLSSLCLVLSADNNISNVSGGQKLSYSYN